MRTCLNRLVFIAVGLNLCGDCDWGVGIAGKEQCNVLQNVHILFCPSAFKQNVWKCSSEVGDHRASLLVPLAYVGSLAETK